MSELVSDIGHTSIPLNVSLVEVPDRFFGSSIWHNRRFTAGLSFLTLSVCRESTSDEFSRRQ